MDSIDKIQNDLIEELNLVGDGFDQYSYLVELSMELPNMDDDLKSDDKLVEGCQSKVWLDMHCENGVFTFSSDSNTMIMKGVLEILREMFDGQNVSDVANTTVTVFEQTEILASFDVDRQKGIGYIVNTIKNFANNHAL